jgi:hypothetical protein
MAFTSGSSILNDSILGLVMKLDVLGVPGMTRSMASWATWGYTAVVVAVVVLVARRPAPDRWHQGLRWLAFLQLGAMRSPYLPDLYGVFGPVWIAVLLAARPGRARFALATAAWVSLSVFAVLSWALANDVSERALAGILLAGQLLAIAITAIALRPQGGRHGGVETAAEPEAALSP